MHNPRTIYRWAGRIAIVAAPLPVLLMAAWAFRLPLVETRPHLVTMAFMFTLMVSAGAGVVAALASCHLAAHKAFSAGYSAGATATAVRVGAEPAARPALHVVGSENPTT
jgi:hypothetical protein